MIHIKRLLLPNYSDNTFYCFSPLASLLTFVIELAFALYVLFRYKSTLFSRLCIVTLVCLGLFQLSEYEIYTHIDNEIWIKVGYVSITILPALGIHIIETITKKHTFLMVSAYILAVILIFSIVFLPGVHLQALCQKYNIDFTSNPLFMISHLAYYTGYMLAGIYILWYSIRKHIGDTKEEKWMIASYVVFIIPSITLFYIHAITFVALPSVMCCFAIFTAVIFTTIIIPRYYKIRSNKEKTQQNMR